jgi:membrane-associated phospholipid phosphatase
MSAIDFTQPSSANPVEGVFSNAYLTRAEWGLFGLIAVIGLGAFGIATWRHQAVAWAEFAPVFLISLELILIGAFARRSRRKPRLALGMIGFGLFMFFSQCSAVFIYTLFPFVHPLMDPTLLELDAKLGFSWVGIVDFIATNCPNVGILLRYVYLSIMPQVAGIILLLSVLGREVELHRFLTVGIVGLVLTIGFWWLFPSVGPAAFGMVSPEAQASIRLNAGEDYGAYMRQLANEGLPLITPAHITGVVAFPSFHMVLTSMAIWFSRKTWMFVPLLILNITMPLATVVQGGHHLVDVFGGLAVFGICLWLAKWLIPDLAITSIVDPGQ